MFSTSCAGIIFQYKGDGTNFDAEIALYGCSCKFRIKRAPRRRRKWTQRSTVPPGCKVRRAGRYCGWRGGLRGLSGLGGRLRLQRPDGLVEAGGGLVQRSAVEAAAEVFQRHGRAEDDARFAEEA